MLWADRQIDAPSNVAMTGCPPVTAIWFAADHGVTSVSPLGCRQRCRQEIFGGISVGAAWRSPLGRESAAVRADSCHGSPVGGTLQDGTGEQIRPTPWLGDDGRSRPGPYEGSGKVLRFATVQNRPGKVTGTQRLLTDAHVADGAHTPAGSWHSRGRGFDSLRLHFAIRSA